MNTQLQEAVWAVIARWDSPAWKDMPHTSEYIDAMREALADEQEQAVEPVAWEHFFEGKGNRILSYKKTAAGFPYCDNASQVRPLYLHPAPPASAQQVAVPSGYAVVPLEPTGEMLVATDAHPGAWTELVRKYKAMLAAAQGAKK